MFFNFGKPKPLTEEEIAARAKMKMVVVKSRCPQNHPCPSIRVCPVGALSQVGYSAPVIDQKKCTKCGRCIRSCVMGAFKLQ